MYEHLKDKLLEGTFLLAINGISIRSITEITHVLDDFDTHKVECHHARFTGFTFLFGKLTNADILPGVFDFQATDHATMRSIFSLCLDIHSLDPTIPSAVSDESLNHLLFLCSEYDPIFIANLFSIIATPQLCSSSFAAALRDPVT